MWKGSSYYRPVVLFVVLLQLPNDSHDLMKVPAFEVSQVLEMFLKYYLFKRKIKLLKLSVVCFIFKHLQTNWTEIALCFIFLWKYKHLSIIASIFTTLDFVFIIKMKLKQRKTNDCQFLFICDIFSMVHFQIDTFYIFFLT